MNLGELFRDPKVLGAIAAVATALAGVTGVTAVDATGEKNDAIERAQQRVADDIRTGFEMCRSSTETRIERGEERVVPNVPEKKIERIANEAVQDAVEGM